MNVNNQKPKRFAQLVFLLLSVPLLSGCDMGFQTMDAGEYGVVFNKLPIFLGGGVQDSAIEPGEMEFILPWQELYRVDTTYQLIGWGAVGQGTNQRQPDYVETRALDGNEVGLAVTIQYHIDPSMVTHVVQKVGTSMTKVRDLVAAAARADIRTHMNILKTRDFFSQEERQAAVDQTREAMQARLSPEGINVISVIYKDHRFERAGDPGEEPDRRYQEQIDRTQAVNQETLQEENRRAAIEQAKGREQEEMQGQVNRLVQTAMGYKRQAIKRGDAYREKKQNEAAQIETAGMNSVEAMKQRIAALDGPGGEALLRLDIARALIKRNPKFVLINSADTKGGGVGISKIDQNKLIEQAGLFAAAYEGVKTDTPAPATISGAPGDSVALPGARRTQSPTTKKSPQRQSRKEGTQ